VTKAGWTMENEACETATRNSEINTVLMNSLIKTTQTLLSLFLISYSLNKLQHLVKRKKKKS
jgi:hypothetical protein